MKRKDTPKWSELLDRVQYIKNTRFHRGIGRTPIKVLFGFDENDTESQTIHGVPEAEECEEYFQEFYGPSEEYVEEEGTPWPDKEATISYQREQAGQALQRQADRMLQASKNRYGAIEVGTSVLVAIPDVDRPKAGARSIMAVVLEEKHGFYKLGTRHGYLPNFFARNQVEPLEETFVLPSAVPGVELPSFRAAISFGSITGGQVHKHYNCYGKCDRCSCKARVLLCNSRCQKNNSFCRNK